MWAVTEERSCRPKAAWSRSKKGRGPPPPATPALAAVRASTSGPGLEPASRFYTAVFFFSALPSWPRIVVITELGNPL